MTIKEARNSEAGTILRDFSRAELEEYYSTYAWLRDKNDPRAEAFLEKYAALSAVHERVFGEEAEIQLDGIVFHSEGVA